MFDLGLHFEVCSSDMRHVSQRKNNMKLLSCRHVADIDAAYLVSHFHCLQCLSRQSILPTADSPHHPSCGRYHLAGCSCPTWTREARSCSAPGSRLPCQRESGLYNDGAPTYTHTAVGTCMYNATAETFIANTSIEAPPIYSNVAYHQHSRLAQRCEHPYQSSLHHQNVY